MPRLGERRGAKQVIHWVRILASAGAHPRFDVIDTLRSAL
jgi:hypothetical protein